MLTDPNGWSAQAAPDDKPPVCGRHFATRGTTPVYCALALGHRGMCRPSGFEDDPAVARRVQYDAEQLAAFTEWASREQPTPAAATHVSSLDWARDEITRLREALAAETARLDWLARQALPFRVTMHAGRLTGHREVPPAEWADAVRVALDAARREEGADA